MTIQGRRPEIVVVDDVEHVWSEFHEEYVPVDTFAGRIVILQERFRELAEAVALDVRRIVPRLTGQLRVSIPDATPQDVATPHYDVVTYVDPETGEDRYLPVPPGTAPARALALSSRAWGLPRTITPEAEFADQWRFDGLDAGPDVGCWADVWDDGHYDPSTGTTGAYRACGARPDTDLGLCPNHRAALAAQEG